MRSHRYLACAAALTTCLMAARAQSADPSSPEHLANERLGVGWAFVYGYQGVPAVQFLPEVRALRGGFAKIYVFWNQLEPMRGQYDWSATDAFVEQLQSPDEGLIAVYSSSSWATTHSATMIPASPAKDRHEYYRFIRDLVARYKGRVRYWQNDCEPNNPVFWNGTKEQFVDQLKVFYRAVKAADPAAVVLAGGYDGLFNPPPAPPMHNQAAGLEFFDYVFAEGRDAFDVFDLRLYADPYTILARVDHIRARMQAHGYAKPIFSTEYGGPGFFEFGPNRLYIPLVLLWSHLAAAGGDGTPIANNPIAQMYKQRDELAPETQIFLMDCSPELEAKFQRLQSREIAIRNVLALAAGVERTAYWQFLNLSLPRDNLMQLMYGKIGLMAVADGQLAGRLPIADAFERTAKFLAGARSATRVKLPAHPDVYYFAIDRGQRGPAGVVWQRRDTFFGEDQPSVAVSLPWSHGPATAQDVLGTAVEVITAANQLEVPVSVTPIFLDPLTGATAN